MDENEKDIAVLIGVDFEEEHSAEGSLEELELLAKTAGIETAFKSVQRRKTPSPSTYIGRGKAEEIAEICKQYEVNLVILDDELKGSQIRELEEIFDMRVIDRTTLILDIFAARATSLEGVLQVELAQHAYRLPRLTGMGKSLSRLGGGIGTRGPGETKLETDKRHIRRRMYAIQTELEEVAKRRELSRKKRKKDGAVTVALVGYTNAGKSSLMNAMCENAAVFVKDQLFATLDPTIRRLETDGDDVLFVDTVGFIRKLPHALVSAFRSTLEESLSADLLLIVADASDTKAEEELEVVSKLLFDLGANDKPTILVLNKADKSENVADLKAILSYQYKVDVMITSAATGEGLEELKQAVLKTLFSAKEYNMVIPYTDGAVLGTLHDCCKIISTSHEEDGTHIRAKINAEDISKFERYFV